ncbi:MAG: MOSC domain-containing protein [Thermoleophilaceae bacterium]
MSAGTVSSLYRWPVKSFAGEPIAATVLDRRGLAGDRAHALFDRHKGAPRRLTIRQAPGMLHWSAAYEGRIVAPDHLPLPRLTGPDGRSYAWDDPCLPAALSEDLGRPVDLHRDPALMPDLADSVLITTKASLEAVGAGLGRPLDLRRFRPNIHVAFDAPAFAEEGWQGRRLQVGEAELELLHPCERCVIPTRDPDTAAKHADIIRWLVGERANRFGINARAVARASIAVGDAVQLI